MIGGYAAIGCSAATGNWRTAALLLAVMAVVMVGGVFLHWRRFEYRVGVNEIRIDSGILKRTHRSIPFDRIQDVDISQGPILRLLGLARVKFETGGSAGGKDDDGALAGIALTRAETLRDQVRSLRGAGGVVTASEADAASNSPIVFSMDIRRVLVAGVFNFSLAIIAALFGITQTIGDVAGFDLFARRFWRQALDAGSPIVDLILPYHLFAVLAGAVLLIAIGLAAGVIRTVAREFRFRLDRTSAGLRRRRGLFTLTDVTLPIRRIQAAIIASGPVRDNLGWSELKLQSLASDDGSKGDHVVAPLAREYEIASILGELDWRPLDTSVPTSRISRAYAWSFTAPAALLLIPLVILSLVMPWIGAAGLTVVAVLITTRWLCWRRFRYALDTDRLLIRSGWWRRRRIILPLSSIQSADVTESIFSRLFGVAAVTFGVASGRGYSSHRIPAVNREIAYTLRRQALAAYL
ncbi:PH domain-containing protein [Sphingomonas japonica]|uniref:Membrane protein n=2 Tax=Sphingomonas japonica TaxID=511662 RepID=A0ABX0U414_9SPHN|nr:PH domain-containing protein [Sphingomonas japonica]NIJ25224.1 putative membrane protein [Sphingomonas japonica]